MMSAHHRIRRPLAVLLPLYAFSMQSNAVRNRCAYCTCCLVLKHGGAQQTMILVRDVME
jgi:hypothetical protein